MHLKEVNLPGWLTAISRPPAALGIICASSWGSCVSILGLSVPPTQDYVSLAQLRELLLPGWAQPGSCTIHILLARCSPAHLYHSGNRNISPGIAVFRIPVNYYSPDYVDDIFWRKRTGRQSQPGKTRAEHKGRNTAGWESRSPYILINKI